MILEKNGIDIPHNLDQKVFQEVTEKAVHHVGVNIKKVSFKMASAPGDNYTSQIYQVHIVYALASSEDSTTSIIIKSMPSSEYTKPLDILDVYQKETVAYFVVHPQINKLLPGVKVAPECYYATREPIKTFIFEDLKAKNYRNVRREVGLDENHARMVLAKLAQYHAASMLFCEKDPEVYKHLNQSHFNSEIMKTDIFKNLFTGSMREVQSLAATWPGYKNIAKKLEYFTNNFERIMLDHVDPSQDDIKVLNHGDVWVANIMFQYDSEESNKPKEVVFVDFQIGFIASPGIDVNYFLNTSLKLDVLKTKREELISHYYDALSATLRKLGYENIPSESAIRNEVHRKELYGLVSLCTVAPMVCMDPKDCHDNSLETMSDEKKLKEKQKMMFSSQRLIETLQYSLKRFDELKVLDLQ